LLALGPGGASAQSNADRATARQLTAEAERKLAARDYEAAHGLLAKAYALVPSPMIKVGMGRAKAAQGQLIEAQQHFVDASNVPARPNEPASWAPARETARREAEAITPRLASLEFVVDGPPGPGAVHVTIDDHDEVTRATLENAIPRAVNPGAHALRAEAEGFKPFETRVSAAEGEKKKVSIRLQASAPATAAKPAPAERPRPGPPGGEPTDDKGSHWSPVAIGGLAAAGAFGAVGAVTGIVSWTRVRAIETRCKDAPCQPGERANIDSARKLGNISTIAFVGAGVGAAVALGAYLMASPSPKAGKAPAGKVRAFVGPGLLGVSGDF
jgi:hypothetical protein